MASQTEAGIRKLPPEQTGPQRRQDFQGGKGQEKEVISEGGVVSGRTARPRRGTKGPLRWITQPALTADSKVTVKGRISGTAEPTTGLGIKSWFPGGLGPRGGSAVGLLLLPALGSVVSSSREWVYTQSVPKLC